ncbi:hypothetical protein [Tessaracoccus defluvii]|uniref:Uncharacterized protein n=1 Tax=Tessaracoccus defluvii TaxID=1285901 RepID=A0A7H0H6Y8_9ACTN|nr:hypothetical protein [Tessaracoccus defluvii]QNP56304.1 hypothetical protein H9L22_02175 [Tessaracoccus defluvii]
MTKPAMVGVVVGAVTWAMLQDMVFAWVSAGYAPRTVHTACSYVSSILREARFDGLP